MEKRMVLVLSGFVMASMGLTTLIIVFSGCTLLKEYGRDPYVPDPLVSFLLPAIATILVLAGIILTFAGLFSKEK
jgi:hypothetical protein